MAADPALGRDAAPSDPGWRLSRLPPGGRPFGLEALRAVLRTDPSASEPRSVEGALAAQLGGGVVALHGSGRAALVSVFARLAQQSGRREVIVPAYTCYSVPAAAVAAGLLVRLVDVDRQGRIDVDGLSALPLERAAAVLVSNLFGRAERITEVVALAHERGCAVVDDAAQALGARDESGPVGGRADAGIMSFGRGKPVSALGGGAAWWPTAEAPSDAPDGAPGAATSTAVTLARVLAYDVALVGPVFRMLAAIPSLHIGETEFDPEIDDAGISGSARALLGLAVEHARPDAEARSREANRIADAVSAASGFEPLLAGDAAGGVYPRLAVLAPSAESRAAALPLLTRLGAGASAMYPASLDQVSELAPHRTDTDPCPVARALAARLVTLPTHGRLRGRRLDDALRVLARSSE